MIRMPELTERARKLIEKCRQFQQPRPEKNWDIIFLKQAFEWSSYTNDAQTGCGAILVKNRRIIASGYNGFIQGVEDNFLPNIRPAKYPWMIHAEHNAILDCARNGKCAEGCTVYVTGKPCLNCYQFMYQAGVVEIVYGNNDAVMTKVDEEYEANVEVFLWLTRHKLNVRYVDYPHQ